MGEANLRSGTLGGFNFSAGHHHTLSIHRLQNIQTGLLPTRFNIDIYLPPAYTPTCKERFPVLFFNDGQDMKAVRLADTLLSLYAAGEIPPIIVVALHAGERLQEYGTAHRADYRSRGSKAGLYSQFIVNELLPYLHHHYPIEKSAKNAAFAGFSLGGLSAMDLVWNHPHIFGKAGVFSGSFWWRYRDFSEHDPDGGRILHEYLLQSQYKTGLKFWFQTGTLDETDDRNKNGVIDAIDDTLDVIDILKKMGYHHKNDIYYREVKDGIHHPSTWAQVLPEFLVWAFGCKH